MPKADLTPIDKDVGRRLRLLRIERGLSQVDLGAKIGVTFQQIQKYENGSNRISTGRLKSFCDVLDAPASYFFGSEKSDKEDEKVFEFVETAHALRLVKAYSKIESSVQRSALVHLAESLIAKDK